MKTLGTDQFDVYLKTYGIHFETDLETLLRKSVNLKLHKQLQSSDLHPIHLYSYAKQPWTRYITPETQQQVSAESMDLLDKLLKYDHRERLTAREAQAHTYFSEIFLPTVSIFLSNSSLMYCQIRYGWK